MIWMLVFAALALFANVSAEPRQWDAEGLPVRIVEGLSWARTQAVQPDGRTLTVWTDARSGRAEVYGQLFSAEGQNLWDENGRLLATDMESRLGNAIAVPLSDGFAIGWISYSDFYTGDDRSFWGAIRVNKVNFNGASVWSPVQSGIEVTSLNDLVEEGSLAVVPDGAGGVYVGWQSPVGTLNLQRLNHLGDPAWQEPLSLVLGWGSSNITFAELPDASGNLAFGWSAYVSSGHDQIFVNKFSRDGALQWGETGIVLSTLADNVRSLRLVQTQSGALYAAWQESRQDFHDRVYAQHATADGSVAWTPGGVLLSDFEIYDPGSLSLALSYSEGVEDGALISWNKDVLGGAGSSFIQKFGTGETPLWTNGGVEVLVETEEYYDGTTRVASDRAGGAILARSLLRSYLDMSLSLLRLNTQGTVLWGASPRVELQGIAWSTWGNSVRVHESTDVALFWQDNADGFDRILTQRFGLADGVAETESPLPAARTIAGDAGYQYPNITSLGNGNTVFMWRDNRFSAHPEKTFFQILDQNGAEILPHNGISIASYPADERRYHRDVRACADGNGGFFAAIESGEMNGSYFRIRTFHVDGDGTQLGDPFGTVLFNLVPQIDERDPFCITDGNGGAYVTCNFFDQNFYLNIAVMRVNSACEPLWDAPVILNHPDYDDETYKPVVGQDNSLYVVYRTGEFRGYDAMVARISLTGEHLWTTEITTEDVSVRYSDVDACADGAGGVYVSAALESRTPFSSNDVILQRLDADGTRTWGDYGRDVAASVEWESHAFVTADPLGTVTVAFERYTQDIQLDIYAQRFSSDGQRHWPEGGIVLTSAPFDQSLRGVVAVHDNELYAIWDDQGTTGDEYDPDILGTHINGEGYVDGDDHWVNHRGGPICDNQFWQVGAGIVADGVGGVIVGWADTRNVNSQYRGVYAQRLYDPLATDADEQPVVPREFSLAQNYPNPFNPETVIEFALPNASQASLKIHDVTGREVATLVNEPLTAGAHRVMFNAQSLPSGVYFYTLRAADHSLTRKMVLLK
ncbi:MAG: T9SS type A sorting domain-containing protein [Calditrichaeota bacterium]|nr:T9SS type A sorting domain-containing protein [Calditrichota bacterium]